MDEYYFPTDPVDALAYVVDVIADIIVEIPSRVAETLVYLPGPVTAAMVPLLTFLVAAALVRWIT